MKKECLILSALISTASAFSQHKAPNIIFILCDDMGYGDLGCYGQKYINTPHIDQMAAEGMRFTQAYAGSPVSAPSRATLMTGQHSGHTHVRGNKEYWPQSAVVTCKNAPAVQNRSSVPPTLSWRPCFSTKSHSIIRKP